MTSGFPGLLAQRLRLPGKQANPSKIDAAGDVSKPFGSSKTHPTDSHEKTTTKSSSSSYTRDSSVRGPPIPSVKLDKVQLKAWQDLAASHDSVTDGELQSQFFV